MAIVATETYLVRETQVDLLGHLNNAAYLQMFEDMRWDVIHQRGYGFAEILKRNQGPVILEAQIKFLKELKVRDQVIITMELVEYPSKVGKLLQKMILPDGQVACEAVFVFGLFDLAARKLISPTPEWAVAVGLTL